MVSLNPRFPLSSINISHRTNFPSEHLAEPHREIPTLQKPQLTLLVIVFTGWDSDLGLVKHMKRETKGCDLRHMGRFIDLLERL
jgi:hypothetical protein